MIVIVITVVFWVFEVCELVYTYTVISDAAHEGVRYAIVHSGLTTNDPNVHAHVLKFAGLSMHNVSGLSTRVDLPDGSATPPNRVQVTVTYTYVPYLGSLIGAPAMRAYAEGRMVVE